MRIMSAKQYEKTLDEQFVINGVEFLVARFPNGWTVQNITEDYLLVQGVMDKKTAIQFAEVNAKGKYNPKETRFL